VHRDDERTGACGAPGLGIFPEIAGLDVIAPLGGDRHMRD